MTDTAVNPGGLHGASDRPADLAQARVLIFGGGYTGRRLAAALTALAVPVLLTIRHQRSDGPGRWLVFDPDGDRLPTAADLAGITHGLVTIPPDGEGRDPVLRHLGDRLRDQPLRWLGYLSTTGVYGDRRGGWVDEGMAPTPAPGRSMARLRAEEAWRASGLPLQVLRLPAIYGPWRNPFAGLRQGTARLVHKPGQVFSRIHVDDIVGAVLHLLGRPPQQRPDTLILADSEPCPSSEVLGYAAHLLGCRLPEAQSFERIAATLSPMARSFWSENRRADNRLLCQGVGYRLRYPSYREGLAASLAEEQSAGTSGGGGGTPGMPSS
jgi:nucleoside-diphosphate-sugar epimerase